MVVGNKSIFFAFILAKEEIKQGFKQIVAYADADYKLEKITGKTPEVRSDKRKPREDRHTEGKSETVRDSQRHSHRVT